VFEIMNYLNPNLYNVLAAQYVLGTLRGPARQRFSKLIMQNSEISEAVNRWELYLNSLGEQLPDIAPDADVWRKIEERLGFSKVQTASPKMDVISEPTTKSSSVVPLPTKKPRLWQGLTALASAAAVVLAVLLVQMQPMPVSEVKQIAVISNQQTDPLWSIEITDEEIAIRATKALQAKANADYELWIVPADGSSPVSLGLLPKAGVSIFVKPVVFEQINIAALAVSLEPLGGSPNGSPTEVLFTGKLVIL
jgi:anti-sigma-K factor RskA